MIFSVRRSGVRNARRYVVAALDRGLTILQTLATDKTPLSLHEIVARAHIPKTTTFRLLVTLERRGFVARTRDRAYRIGRSARRLT